jgi:hypothetical protein
MNQRVTIRLPQELAEAMDLRSRLSDTSLNAEYVRAIGGYLQGDGEVVTVDCPAGAVHGWVTRDDIAAVQISPVKIAMRSVGGRTDGFVLRGRVVAIDRQWFVSDDTFASARTGLETVGIPLIAETEAWWSQQRGGSQILTFGWAGPPPRRVTAQELRLGRDAVLDYLIHVNAGDDERSLRASVSPEAWFRILQLVAPDIAPSWPDSRALRGVDRLVARAFLDVVSEESVRGAKEILVRSFDDDLVKRISERAKELRATGVHSS